MKIAVMGAGAVGCWYGGLLARAGHDVSLVGRPAHVEAMQQNGLRLQSRDFDEPVSVRASTDATVVADADLVLCCVKAPDTVAAATAMAPHLRADTVVLSLQNGVDNAEQLQRVLPQRVVPTVVYVATAMAGPGHVQHFGRGELVLSHDGLPADALAAFEAAGIPVQLSDNVQGALWSKLILNSAFNALSAITQVPYGVLWPSQGMEAVVRDLVDECEAVAAAEGIALPQDSWAAIQKIAESMPAQYSSTAQDLARGKPSEIDHLNGFVVRRGQALGVATPVNRAMHALVKLMESHPAGRPGQS